jgi:uncharacterized Zn finger protein (UPF0148 family)
MKHCTRAEHKALRELPEDEWNKLGHGKDWDFPETGEVLEQRHCPKCGSTLARHKKKGTHVTL